MSFARAVSSVVLGLAVWISASLSPAFPAPCSDVDGDGYGSSCCLGGDCDESDAGSHFGALEICDGKDNNCDGLVDSASGAFTVDAGMSCSLPGLGVCGDGVVRCIAAGLQCVPRVASGPEVCNGLDDDCDGVADDVGGVDADGDGVGVACDCNDADPALSAPLQTDANGKRFCLQLDPIQAYADRPSTPITVRGYHEMGIGSLTIVMEFVSQEQQACNAATSCTYTRNITQAFEGPRYVRARLVSPLGAIVTQVDRRIRFGCEGLSCPQDPRIGDFVSWMRQRGYPECVVNYYVDRALDPLRLTRLKDSLNWRPNGLTQQYALEFWDIVPTDAQSSFASLGAGEGGRCTTCSSWPDYCPNRTAADYRFVERHFERTFGIDFTFTYGRMNIPYATTLPNFRQVSTSGGTRWDWDPPTAFLSQFPPHSIVHFAMQSLQGTLIQDHNRGGFLVDTTFEPNYINGIAGGTGGYTHEWGHTWGLGHSFLEIPTFFDPRTDGSDIAGLDGVTENGYYYDTRVVDPLEPVERYALEPSAGFTDQATFASAYSTRLTGTYRMPQCGKVDPAFTSARVTSSTAETWNIEVNLKDNGTLAVGYVSLQARNGSAGGAVIEDRTIGRVAPGSDTMALFAIPRSSVTSGGVTFVLDAANVIREANTNVPDDSETNNQTTVVIPPACPDVDADGYAAACGDCTNLFCPFIDCNDADPGVNPATAEGPPGTATCADGKDNNCADGADGADYRCIACADADGDGYASPNSLCSVTCSNAFCPFLDCDDGDPTVSPADTEGPYGSPTCLDGKNNNCVDGTDGFDPRCAPPPPIGNAVSETTQSGSKTGDFHATWVSDDSYEVLKEGGAGVNLIHTWRFDNVGTGSSHDLILEANRPNNNEGDNFAFSFSTTGAEGSFTAIPGAVIDKAFEIQGGVVYRIPQEPLASTIFIRVVDTVPGGTKQATVRVDYLAVRTNP